MPPPEKYIKLLSNKFITEISLPADLLEDSEIQSVVKQYEWIVLSTSNEWYKLIKKQVYHS